MGRLMSEVVLPSARAFKEMLGVASNNCVLFIVMLILLSLATKSTGEPSPWKGQFIYSSLITNMIETFNIIEKKTK